MNRSLLVKTLVVAALALVLVIPVQMIQGLVAERQARAAGALAGIAEGWGKRQTGRWTHAIATAACVAIITIYLLRVLRSIALGLAFGAALAGLYGLLYALLKAEDYSLLGGAILLFALLAGLMISTRRVDWYALTAKATAWPRSEITSAT